MFTSADVAKEPDRLAEFATGAAERRRWVDFDTTTRCDGRGACVRVRFVIIMSADDGTGAVQAFGPYSDEDNARINLEDIRRWPSFGGRGRWSVVPCVGPDNLGQLPPASDSDMWAEIIRLGGVWTVERALNARLRLGVGIGRPATRQRVKKELDDLVAVGFLDCTAPDQYEIHPDAL